MKAKPTKPHFWNPADGQLRLKTLRAKTICRLSPLNLHTFFKRFTLTFVSDKEYDFNINAAFE